MRILQSTDKVNTVRKGSHTSHPLEGLQETRTAIECGFDLVVMRGRGRKSLHFMCAVYKPESEWI